MPYKQEKNAKNTLFYSREVYIIHTELEKKRKVKKALQMVQGGLELLHLGRWWTMCHVLWTTTILMSLEKEAQIWL